MPIPVKLDILALTSSPKGTDYEAATEIYNKAGKRASFHSLPPGWQTTVRCCPVSQSWMLFRHSPRR